MKLIALAASAATLAGGVEASDLRYTRMVEGPGGAHVAVEPDGPMFAHARPGFADVRVVDARGEQVPWRTRPPGDAVLEQPVLVLNSGRRGREAVALLDLGRRRAIRDRVVLSVPDRDFVGRAVVLGADRREGPYTRLGATGIYDASGARRARSTTVVFPTTDHRFVLVRATGVTRISGATVARGPDQPFEVDRLPRRTSVREAGRETIVTLDFGLRRVPVDELRVTAATPAYDRPVVVELTNDGAGRRWSVTSSGRISRFEGSSASPIPVHGRARLVRVRIENGDDPPLERLAVRAFSRSFVLLLEGGHPTPYTMYYGAPSARAPNYEFARIPLAADERVVAGSLTPERPNPAFEPPGRTFGERNRWIVGAALAAAALAVGIAGLLALRRRA